jgi:exosortase
VTTYVSYKYFALLSVASLLIWHNALLATFTLAVRNGGYTHTLLILPVSLLLVFLEWKKGVGDPSPGWLVGSTLLGLAALIGFWGLKWGRADIFLTIEMLALVCWWIGSFVFCFGGRIFGKCAFPLLFLLWIVPMPGFALDRIVALLQAGTTSFARQLFTVVGVPVTRNGTTLAVPGLTVEVAQECSSIRSSMMLVVCSVLISYLLLRSFLGRTVVTLAAIPLSIAKNGIRVFTLTALGAYVDPEILKGPLHHQGGALFFALALAGELAMIWIVGRVERREIPASVKAPLSRLSAPSIN